MQSFTPAEYIILNKPLGFNKIEHVVILINDPIYGVRKMLNSTLNASCGYLDEGYEVVNLLNKTEFELVKNYSLEMLSTLFKKYSTFDLSEARILEYHRWCVTENVPHSSLLKASNRHTTPPEQIKTALINDCLISFLSKVGIHRFRVWDEGLGWLGFRLIRPAFGDGYPFSCKNWGPAKNVISIWLPILGFSTELMLNLIPRSHQKEYSKYLPEESQFAANECRLNYQPAPEETLRPVTQRGQAVIFHPKTMHSEEVTQGESTRFSLEFRIEPL